MNAIELAKQYLSDYGRVKILLVDVYLSIQDGSLLPNLTDNPEIKELIDRIDKEVAPPVLCFACETFIHDLDKAHIDKNKNRICAGCWESQSD